MLTFCACLLFPSLSLADEQIIVSLSLNQQKIGDLFVILREDGDVLLRTVDLQKAGFRQISGRHVETEGETYVSLRSMEGVDYHFDEMTLTLELFSAPELLPKVVVDLSPPRQQGVIYPRDNSIFLNYGLDYSASGEEDLAFAGLTASNELGVRLRDLLLLTDTLYTESPDDSHFVRLNTSLTWDNRNKLHRAVAGDFFASSGNLGSRVQMGGLSFSKVYHIDPNFIRYPLFDFSGLISLPSDVDLYVDGLKVRTEHFAPGGFELRNFQSIVGSQNVEVIIRDALGREQRIVSPFYFTDKILRRGLHEYSYNLGFLRRDFGAESNDYSDLALSAFHRYGFTDELNLGARGEAGNGLMNLGGESVFKAGPFGLVHLEMAGSSAGGDMGGAALASYDFQSRNFWARLAIQGFSGTYRTLADITDTTDTASRRKLDLRAGCGYTTPQLGSFGFNYFQTRSYDETDRAALTLSWSRRLLARMYFNVNLRQVRNAGTSYEGNVNLSWYLGSDLSLSAGYRHERGTDYQTLEARQNVPLGEGTGWDVRSERSTISGSSAYALKSSAQHNGAHGILRGDFGLGHSEVIDTQDLRLGLFGALVHIGDTFALTRPVTDSFALVSVGQVEGIRVYANGQTAGRTNSHGQAVIPELSSYYNDQVAIEDTDIPIDYLMPRVRLFVSPPLRSGSCLNFPLRRYQAFTGTLLRDEAGGEPLANAELILAAPDGPVDFWTGGDGEFYFDSQMATVDSNRYQGCDALDQGPGDFLPAGSYEVTVKLENETYQAQVTIPKSTGETVDLGNIVCRRLALGKPAAAEPAILAPPTNVGTAPASGAPPNVGAENTIEKGPLPPSPVTPEERPEPIPDRVVVQFPFNRSRPFPQELEKLQPMVRYLQSHPGMKLEILGYTCSRGTKAYNLKLGRRRAESVRDYLFNAGIEAGRILRVVSRGEANPVCSESTPGCQTRNRRVVMTVVAGEE